MSPFAAHCGSLLVGISLVAGSATPTLATWTLDQATKDAVEICDRSFATDNADVPFLKKSTAKALHKACTWGVQYGHEALYEPYQKNERDTENKDYPIAVPPLAEFRADYEEGIQKCLASGSGYPADSRLQERMACMDGFDAFAGNIAALHPDTKVEETADFSADHDYYEKRDYLSVYQDISDNRTWAYVLADRTFHPNHYPGYRRDMLFAPKNIPDDVKDKANAALMAMNAKSGEQKKDENGQPVQSSNAATPSTNSNFWFWYWYWHHYNSHSWWSSPGAYSASTTYRRDTSPRMEYAGSQVSGPPSAGDDRRAGYAGGGGGGGSAAWAGSRASTAQTGSNASPSPQFGTRATGGDYAKASPWSSTKLSTTTSGQLGATRGFIVRGGLGAYGGYAGRADGARAGSIPKVSTPYFNTARGAVGANFSAMGGGSKAGAVTISGGKSGGGVGGGSFGSGFGGGAKGGFGGVSAGS